MTIHLSAALTLGRERLSGLVAALRQAGVRFNAYAEEMLGNGRLEVATQPFLVRVEVHSIAALGWADGATLDQVLHGVADRGLSPCPLEVALLLRLAWRDEPVSPRITVASARTSPDEARPRGFYLRDDAEGCWLRAYVASDDWVHRPDERLALVRSSPPDDRRA
jgi:hypothetical protein